MVHGIAPLVEGTSDRQRHVAMSAHLLGGPIGGAMTAVAFWLVLTPLRTLLTPAVPAVMILLVIAAVARDLGLSRWDSRQNQVPQAWFAYHGVIRSYALYGLALGSSLLTHVPVTLTYVVVGLAALQPSILWAVAAGALLGLGRTLMVGPAAHMSGLEKLLLRGFTDGHRFTRRISAVAAVLLCVLALRHGLTEVSHWLAGLV